MRRFVFGKELIVDVPAVLQAIRAPSVAPVADAHGIKDDVIRRFDATWQAMPHETLLFLIALQEHTKRPLIRLVPSRLWETFSAENAKTVILYAPPPNSEDACDHRCALSIAEGLGVRAEPVAVTNDAEVDVVALMRTHNVICVGSPRYNRASERVLLEFIKLGGPKIEFRFPTLQTETALAKRTTRTERGLRIEGKIATEDHGSGLYYGALAMCRRPFNDGADVTSIVLAGCSYEATVGMTDDLSRPGLYRAYHGSWANTMHQKPFAFLFERKVGKDRWAVFGAKFPKKTPGPPTLPPSGIEDAEDGDLSDDTLVAIR